MNFQCEYCGTDLNVPDHSEGLKAKCPGCRNLTTIPGEKFVMESVQDSTPLEEVLHFQCPHCKKKTSLRAALNPLGKHKKCSGCRQVFPLTEKNLRGASGIEPSLSLGPPRPQRLLYSFEQKNPFQMMSLAFKILFSSGWVAPLIGVLTALLVGMALLLAGGILLFASPSGEERSPLVLLWKALGFLIICGLFSFASGVFLRGILDFCKTGSLQTGRALAEGWRKLGSLWVGGTLLATFVGLVQYFGPDLALSFSKSGGISGGTAFYVFMNLVYFGLMSGFSLLFVVMVEEDKDPLGSLARSLYLTREYLLPIFGFFFLMVLLPFLMALILFLLIVLPFLKGSLVLFAAGLYWALVGSLLSLLYSLSSVVIYYNLKSRKGF